MIYLYVALEVYGILLGTVALGVVLGKRAMRRMVRPGNPSGALLFGTSAGSNVRVTTKGSNAA